MFSKIFGFLGIFKAFININHTYIFISFERANIFDDQDTHHHFDFYITMYCHCVKTLNIYIEKRIKFVLNLPKKWSWVDTFFYSTRKIRNSVGYIVRIHIKIICKIAINSIKHLKKKNQNEA